MDKNLLMAKLRMTALSLAIWAVTAAVLIVCARMFWFQGFLFKSDGGINGLELVIPIDLVLGPGLMFVVYNPNKPRNTKLMDIGIVIAVQLAAFFYGLSQMYDEHPALLSYFEGQFNAVRGEMLDRQKTTVDNFTHLSSHNPPLVFIKTPAREYIPRLVDLSMRLGVAENAQVDLFDSLSAHKAELFANDAPLRDYLSRKVPEVAASLQQYPAGNNKLVWFNGRYSNAVLVFDNETNVVGSFDLPDSATNPTGLIRSAGAKGTAASGSSSMADSGAASAALPAASAASAAGSQG